MSIKEIKYGLICEDDAHKLFLHKFLSVAFDSINFLFNYDFFFRYRANNKKNVLKQIGIIGYDAFENYQLNLLFVGLDYDDLDRKKFNENIEKLYEIIKIKDKTIIFFPVQAIEHWLLYLKYKKKNPQSTKNISFENKSRKDAKKEIYSSLRPSSQRINEKIDEYLDNDDNLKWLASRSESFRNFQITLNNFIKRNFVNQN